MVRREKNIIYFPKKPVNKITNNETILYLKSKINKLLQNKFFVFGLVMISLLIIMEIVLLIYLNDIKVAYINKYTILNNLESTKNLTIIIMLLLAQAIIIGTIQLANSNSKNPPDNHNLRELKSRVKNK